jgi:O-antigen ligase
VTPPPSLPRAHAALLVAAGAYLALLPTGALSFWRSLAFVLAGIATVAVLLGERRAGREPAGLPGRAIPVLVLAWAAWSCASLAWSVDRGFTAGELKADVLWGLATMAIFYVAASRVPVGFDRLAGTTLAALAFWTSLAAGIALSALGWDTNPFHRGDGAFATYLVTVAPFAWLLGWTPPVGVRRHPRAWIVLALLLVLLVVTARLSENRIVWIAFTAGVLIVVFAVPRTGALLPLATAAGVLVVGFVLLFADAAHERAQLVRPQDGSVASTIADDPRLAIWSQATGHIRERPWLGHGYGLHILGREIGRETGDAKVRHPHNLVASQWLQTGAIGALLFVAMFVAVAARFVRYVRSRDVALARLGALGLAVIAGFAIRNLTDDFFLRANGKLLFAACAILLGAGVVRERRLRGPVSAAAARAAAAARGRRPVRWESAPPARRRPARTPGSSP